MLHEAVLASVRTSPRRYGALNVQAGTQLCDGAFQREVASGRLSSASLDDFSCIALAGVASEYLRFGYFQLSLSNVKTNDLSYSLSQVVVFLGYIMKTKIAPSAVKPHLVVTF